jgi:hypothetical protein
MMRVVLRVAAVLFGIAFAGVLLPAQGSAATVTPAVDETTISAQKPALGYPSKKLLHSQQQPITEVLPDGQTITYRGGDTVTRASRDNGPLPVTLKGGLTASWTGTVTGSGTMTGTQTTTTTPTATVTDTNTTTNTLTDTLTQTTTTTPTVTNTATDTETLTRTITVTATATTTQSGSSTSTSYGTWSNITTATANNRGVAVNPTNGDVFAAVLGGEVQKLAGGTGTWSNITTATANSVGVAVNSANGDVLYASISGYVQKLAGGTGTWSNITTATALNWGVAVNSTNGDVFKSVYGYGVDKLSGGSWERVATDTLSSVGVAVNSANGDVLYASISGYVQKLAGGTGTWSNITTATANNRGVAVNSANGDVFVGVSGGYVQKLAGGTGTWSNITTATADNRGVAVNSANGDVFVGVSGGYVQKLSVVTTTSTSTNTSTSTATASHTETETYTATSTSTYTATVTQSATSTYTSSHTATSTSTSTRTVTSTASATSTYTYGSASTHTDVQTGTSVDVRDAPTIGMPELIVCGAGGLIWQTTATNTGTATGTHTVTAVCASTSVGPTVKAKNTFTIDGVYADMTCGEFSDPLGAIGCTLGGTQPAWQTAFIQHDGISTRFGSRAVQQTSLVAGDNGGTAIAAGISVGSMLFTSDVPFSGPNLTAAGHASEDLTATTPLSSSGGDYAFAYRTGTNTTTNTATGTSTSCPLNRACTMVRTSTTTATATVTNSVNGHAISINPILNYTDVGAPAIADITGDTGRVAIFSNTHSVGSGPYYSDTPGSSAYALPRTSSDGYLSSNWIRGSSTTFKVQANASDMTTDTANNWLDVAYDGATVRAGASIALDGSVSGMMSNGVGTLSCYIRVVVDGARIEPQSDSSPMHGNDTQYRAMSVTTYGLVTGLAAGSHTFALQATANGGNTCTVPAHRGMLKATIVQ